MELSNEYRRRNYPEDPLSGIPKVVPSDKNKIIRPDNRKWVSTESTISFDFNKLVKKVKVHIKKQFRVITTEDLVENISNNLKVFTINEQIFEYRNEPNTLGGVRWFVVCPKCGKSCLKLYLPKLKDREHLYLCKACHKLKPISLLYGNRESYKSINRPLKTLDKIRKKLLKKKLQTKEAEELLKEYDRIEKELADSPEYRLWKFREEHK